MAGLICSMAGIMMFISKLTTPIVIQSEAKDLVDMFAQRGYTSPKLRDSTAVCRQPLNDNLMYG